MFFRLHLLNIVKSFWIPSVGISPKSPQVAAPIFPGFWIPGLCYPPPTTVTILPLVISSTFLGLFPRPNPSLSRVSHKERGEQDDFQFGYKKLSGIRKLLSVSCQKGGQIKCWGVRDEPPQPHRGNELLSLAHISSDSPHTEALSLSWNSPYFF